MCIAKSKQKCNIKVPDVLCAQNKFFNKNGNTLETKVITTDLDSELLITASRSIKKCKLFIEISRLIITPILPQEYLWYETKMYPTTIQKHNYVFLLSIKDYLNS